LLETVRVVLCATDSARSPREILLAAGSSGSAPPISRGEQLEPLPDWRSQPSADGLYSAEETHACVAQKLTVLCIRPREHAGKSHGPVALFHRTMG
jgi:hypothetical protein